MNWLNYRTVVMYHSKNYYISIALFESDFAIIIVRLLYRAHTVSDVIFWALSNFKCLNQIEYIVSTIMLSIKSDCLLSE